MSAARPRTQSRLAAVQALFQGEQGQENPETIIDQFVRHRLGAGDDYDAGQIPNADVKLFAAIVRAAVAAQHDVDAALCEILPQDWPLARIDPVLRALFRAAGAELADGAGPPAKVVINEYLDVAHGFFEGEEPRLANGVLNALARRLRAGEFAVP